jgi:hypothetical protein
MKKKYSLIFSIVFILMFYMNTNSQTLRFCIEVTEDLVPLDVSTVFTCPATKCSIWCHVKLPYIDYSKYVVYKIYSYDNYGYEKYYNTEYQYFQYLYRDVFAKEITVVSYGYYKVYVYDDDGKYICSGIFHWI